MFWKKQRPPDVERMLKEAVDWNAVLLDEARSSLFPHVEPNAAERLDAARRRCSPVVAAKIEDMGDYVLFRDAGVVWLSGTSAHCESGDRLISWYPTPTGVELTLTTRTGRRKNVAVDALRAASPPLEHP